MGPTHFKGISYLQQIMQQLNLQNTIQDKRSLRDLFADLSTTQTDRPHPHSKGFQVIWNQAVTQAEAGDTQGLKSTLDMLCEFAFAIGIDIKQSHLKDFHLNAMRNEALARREAAIDAFCTGGKRRAHLLITQAYVSLKQAAPLIKLFQNNR